MNNVFSNKAEDMLLVLIIFSGLGELVFKMLGN